MSCPLKSLSDRGDDLKGKKDRGWAYAIESCSGHAAQFEKAAVSNTIPP